MSERRYRGRPTLVNLSEMVRRMNSEEAMETLENLYGQMQALMRIHTEKRREQMLAEAEMQRKRAEADKAQAEVNSYLLQLLQFASSISDLVSVEPVWLPPYRNSQGDIILECPFTMRDQRTVMRAMKKELLERTEDAEIDIDFGDE